MKSHCSGEEEEPVATAGRRRKSRAVAVKKKQSSGSGGNMAERGVRGDRFDLCEYDRLPSHMCKCN